MTSYSAVSKATDTHDSLYITQRSTASSNSSTQRDKEISEIVINAIQVFFEKNCLSSKIDFLPLSRRPLTHKTCERALELIKLFDDRIVLKRWNVETYHFCHEVRGNSNSPSEHVTNRPLQLSKLEISLYAHEALKRYSEYLRLNGENSHLKEIPVSNPYECTVEHPFHEVDLKYSTQSKLIPPRRKETSEETCSDHCTLF